MSPRPALAANPLEAVTATAPQPAAAAAPRRGAKPAPVPAASGASAAHRVGTIAAPYTRQDGVQVRQWSATLPVDIVEALHYAAIQERRRPADIVAGLIAEYCGLQPAAAPPQPRAAAKPAKASARKTKTSKARK